MPPRTPIASVAGGAAAAFGAGFARVAALVARRRERRGAEAAAAGHDQAEGIAAADAARTRALGEWFQSSNERSSFDVWPSVYGDESDR